MFDEVVVGVYRNPSKIVLFTPPERLEIVQQCVAALPNVTAVDYEGLTVRFAQRIGAHALVRGLRAISDFEYEFAISSMNQDIAPQLETVCLLTSREYAFISSSLIKEVAALGQPVDDWVPASVAARLRAKLAAGSGEVPMRG